MSRANNSTSGCLTITLGVLFALFLFFFGLPAACTYVGTKAVIEEVSKESARQKAARAVESAPPAPDSRAQKLITYEQMPASIAKVEAMLEQSPDAYLEAELAKAKTKWQSMTRLTRDVMARTADGQVGLGSDSILVVVEDRGATLICSFKGQEFEVPADSTDWTGDKG